MTPLPDDIHKVNRHAAKVLLSILNGHKTVSAIQKASRMRTQVVTSSRTFLLRNGYVREQGFAGPEVRTTYHLTDKGRIAAMHFATSGALNGTAVRNQKP